MDARRGDAETEANIQHWEATFAAREWGRYPPEELVRFVGRNFAHRQPRKDIAVLELGCGPGANLWFLANEGYSIAGIDGSATAVEKAQQRLKQELLRRSDLEADLRVGNFASLPWPDQSFDLVFDIEGLAHNRLAVIEAALKEAHRVLKRGGRFFAKMFGTQTAGISTGTSLEPGTTLDPKEGPLAGIGIIHSFSREEILRLLSGFKNVSLDWSRRSDQGERWEVFEWLVSAERP
jgi:ubiquinone/menaquinone biosynthesis C-methylase UbiE